MEEEEKTNEEKHGWEINDDKVTAVKALESQKTRGRKHKEWL